MPWPAIPFLALAVTAAVAPPPPSAPAPRAKLDSNRLDFNPLDFNKDVRPILSDRCFACHGPDSGTRKAGLRLDTPEGAFAALRGGGHAIVPGNLDLSEAAARIRSSDPDDVMPPPELKRPLTDEERATLLRWIEEGAEYQPHWAFVAPAAPAAPAARDAAWARDPLDAFVLARLEQAGLAPEPEADRATLLRRAALALTGLPPTPEEIDAFARDTAPDAYERRVDA
ncbi:MAG: hypothetical protein RLY21_151, partial [Planctomycetota bacterium]